MENWVDKFLSSYMVVPTFDAKEGEKNRKITGHMTINFSSLNTTLESLEDLETRWNEDPPKGFSGFTGWGMSANIEDVMNKYRDSSNGCRYEDTEEVQRLKVSTKEFQDKMKQE